MQERPSGWYDDPDEPSRLRYFDGQQWTDRTHEKAPMPPPQPKQRTPVTRLRPPREERESSGDDGGRDGASDGRPEDRRGREGSTGTRALGSAGGMSTRPEDSPKPWATGVQDAPRSRSAARDGAPGRGEEASRAGFGRRAGAHLIDALIGVVLYVLVFLIPYTFTLGEELQQAQTWSDSFWAATQAGQTPPDVPPTLLAMTSIMMLGFATVFILYDALWLRFAGATPGKLATGVRVREYGTGERASGGVLLRRTLIKYVALLVWAAFPAAAMLAIAFSMVDYTWPLVDREGRALHDKWGNSQVTLR